MIDSFEGKYRFLSNFSTEGAIKPTVEHQFQAMKAAKVEDAIRVMAADTPGQAKRIGRKIELRSDWEEIKVSVMKNLVHRKFFDDDILWTKLIETGDEELVEGNHWGDTFWGVCRGKGENVLGEILMMVREELS